MNLKRPELFINTLFVKISYTDASISITGRMPRVRTNLRIDSRRTHYEKHMKFTALALALILCLGLLSACSTGKDDSTAATDPAESDTPAVTDDAGSETPDETDPAEEPAEDDALEIAEVTAIADDGTLSMTLYTLTEGAEQPTDYAAIDMDLYVAGTDTAEYLPDESVQIYVASDGTLTAATAADIAVGDMLAFYKTEDGGNAIAIYHPAAE